MKLVQINLQPHFGGGEVYTAFLCRALAQLGVPTRLLVHLHSSLLEHLGLPPGAKRVSVVHSTNLPEHLLAGPLSHGSLPTGWIRSMKPKLHSSAIVCKDSE